MNHNVYTSYFNPPIKNIVPLKVVELSTVYELIVSDFLKIWTDKIRIGLASKSEVLPYITPSGTFKKRQMNSLIEYSGAVCIDLDEVNVDLKEKLSKDSVLKPALIFISPGGCGLKLFTVINGAKSENHLLYFSAISNYLYENYQLSADQSGKDLARACFLGQDRSAFYSNRSVDSETLLSFLPPDFGDSVNKPLKPSNAATRYDSISTAVPIFGTPTITSGERPSDRLNRIPEIHNLALNALKRSGWVEGKKERWTRPFKQLKDGHSAKYNFYNNLWLFYCFSSNAHPFKANKAYTDVQIICLLDYNDDFQHCITDLVSKFLLPNY